MSAARALPRVTPPVTIAVCVAFACDLALHCLVRSGTIDYTTDSVAVDAFYEYLAAIASALVVVVAAMFVRQNRARANAGSEAWWFVPVMVWSALALRHVSETKSICPLSNGLTANDIRTLFKVEALVSSGCLLAIMTSCIIGFVLARRRLPPPRAILPSLATCVAPIFVWAILNRLVSPP